MQYFVTVLLCSCNERVVLYLEWIPMFVTGLSNHEHRYNRALFMTYDYLNASFPTRFAVTEP